MGTVLVVQLFVCFIVWARIEFKEISEKLRALKEKRRAFEERKRAARNENF